MNTMQKTFSMLKNISQEIDRVAAAEFNGNRSAVFSDMYTVWKKNRRARQRTTYLRRDKEIAHLIVQAQSEGPLTKKERDAFFAFANDVAAKIKKEGNLETEEEISESIKVIRKKRKDAFESRS